MDYTKCRYCSAKLKNRPETCFFWCDEKCRDTEKSEWTARIKEKNKMHDPAARRGEPDISNELMKYAIEMVNKGLDTGTTSNGPKKKSSGRKCGKCGAIGHNARTCSSKG